MTPTEMGFWNHVIPFGLIILMKIVCFILGYLIVRLGYLLISSGVKGQFKFSAKLAGVQADLASVSPGLLFVLLGVLLIGYAIYVEKEVSTTVTTGPSAPLLDLEVPEGDSPFNMLRENSGIEPGARTDGGRLSSIEEELKNDPEPE